MNTLSLKLLLSFALIYGLSACVKPLYNYEDYSQSYYDSKKNVGAASALELQKSIERCIERLDESRSGRVPPGMYANLGYIYLKNSNAKSAIENFKKEKAIYPESTHFMDRMIKKVQLAEDHDHAQ